MSATDRQRKGEGGSSLPFSSSESFNVNVYVITQKFNLIFFFPLFKFNRIIWPSK